MFNHIFNYKEVYYPRTLIWIVTVEIIKITGEVFETFHSPSKFKDQAILDVRRDFLNQTKLKKPPNLKRERGKF